MARRFYEQHCLGKGKMIPGIGAEGNNRMKKKLTIVGIIVSFVIAALLGIRIYGAFQSEHDSAIARANEADRQAQVLDAKSNEDERELACSTEWLKYKNTLLEQQIAELKGGVGHTPFEPLCEGYAMSLDESMSTGMEGMQALLDASNAREYEKFEREYSTNRPLQARFLAMRLWEFLKGTGLDASQQAMMQKDQDAKKNARK
jgi:hypothetical protein